MNKMSKDKRDKLLLLCIGALGICAVLYFLVITDDQATIAEIDQRIAALQFKKSQSESLLKKQAMNEVLLEEAKKALADKQTDMLKPGEKDHVRYLNILNKRGFTNQLTVFNIIPPEPVEPGVLPRFPFQAQRIHVVMLGAYADFGKFLADFENDYPFVRVQALGIQPDVRMQTSSSARSAQDAAADEGRLRFDFDLIILSATQI